MPTRTLHPPLTIFSSHVPIEDDVLFLSLIASPPPSCRSAAFFRRGGWFTLLVHDRIRCDRGDLRL